MLLTKFDKKLCVLFLLLILILATGDWVRYSYLLLVEVWVQAHMLSHFSGVQFFVTLWTVALQSLRSMGSCRQEYGSGLPCPPPGDFPNLGSEPATPVSQADCVPVTNLGSLGGSTIWCNLSVKYFENMYGVSTNVNGVWTTVSIPKNLKMSGNHMKALSLNIVREKMEISTCTKIWS